jgi:hypothetical protein
MFRGRFILFPDTPKQIILPNTVTNEGEVEFLKMIFRADLTLIAAAANWYIGLCQKVPAEGDTLADLAATEPTDGVNGYSRKAVTRDASGWPTLTSSGGVNSIRSALVTFTAASGAFDKGITRAFLTSSASGTGGKLFSISAALGTAITLADGQSLPIAYESYLD